MELDWMKIAIDLGSFGIVAWLVYFTFSKTLPQMAEKFREELRQERESCERGLKEMADAVNRLSTLLIVHDATVRGLEEHQTDNLLRLMGRYEEEPGD